MPFKAELLDEVFSLWFQSPLVISARLQDLAVKGMTAHNGAEIGRMVNEKLAASAESLLALNAAIASEGMRAAAALAGGTATGMAGAAERLAVAALKPYGKRIRANARRLSK